MARLLNTPLRLKKALDFTPRTELAHIEVPHVGDHVLFFRPHILCMSGKNAGEEVEVNVNETYLLRSNLSFEFNFGVILPDSLTILFVNPAILSMCNLTHIGAVPGKRCHEVRGIITTGKQIEIPQDMWILGASIP